MSYILLFFIFFLLSLIVILFFQNRKMKKEHKISVERLEFLLNTLYQKQIFLKEKLSINSDYNLHHKNKVKKLSEEIVTLQKVFLEIISNKNNA